MQTRYDEIRNVANSLNIAAWDKQTKEEAFSSIMKQ